MVVPFGEIMPVITTCGLDDETVLVSTPVVCTTGVDELEEDDELEVPVISNVMLT
jgi:hypothetical protein